MSEFTFMDPAEYEAIEQEMRRQDSTDFATESRSEILRLAGIAESQTSKVSRFDKRVTIPGMEAIHVRIWHQPGFLSQVLRCAAVTTYVELMTRLDVTRHDLAVAAKPGGTYRYRQESRSYPSLDPRSIDTMQAAGLPLGFDGDPALKRFPAMTNLSVPFAHAPTDEDHVAQQKARAELMPILRGLSARDMESVDFL